MSMEELANVKGRGWEDIDVCGYLITAYGVTKLTASVALIQPRDTALGMQGRANASSARLTQVLDLGIGSEEMQLEVTQHICATHNHTSIRSCQTTPRLLAKHLLPSTYSIVDKGYLMSIQAPTHFTSHWLSLVKRAHICDPKPTLIDPINRQTHAGHVPTIILRAGGATRVGYLHTIAALRSL